MAKGKYKLSFVNEGKPFDLENWSVIKHKKVLETMAAYEEKHKNLSEEDKDDAFQNTLILEGLKGIDKNVKASDLETMHPQDKKALFTAIYFTGREGIVAAKPKGDAANFPK